MQMMRSDAIMAFDVDDTLIMWDSDGPGWKWNDLHIAEMKKAHARGQMVIVWTAGGSAWLEQIKMLLEDCGLDQYVTMLMNKPKWYFDDRDANGWMARCFRNGKDDKGA